MKKILILFITYLVFCACGTCAFATITELPEIYIKAVNPGYTIDGVNNVGEMIEIARTSSDEPMSLAGLSIGYTNSSGNYAILLEFPENSWMVGEQILLRLASSPGHELANLSYKKTLALKAGPLEIRRGDKILDSVCWTGKDGCAADFKASEPTTLIRNSVFEWEHENDYEPIYDEEAFFVEQDEEEVKPSVCKGVIFSEILSYYDNSRDEQFIELYNSSAKQVRLDGCGIKYKNKFYELNGVIKPDGYFSRHFDEMSLTKNPTSMNSLELIDANGDVLDKLDYPNGQRKGASYALIGYDDGGAEIWHVTYAPTPGEPNNYQEYKTCETGKVINPETGNCVKVSEVATKVCKAGYFLNLMTGRCNKIQTATEKVCKEGYVLNEETGRCVKIKENNGANYSLQKEEYEESTSFVALYAVLGVAAIGIIYIIFEFREEILKFLRKVFRRAP